MRRVFCVVMVMSVALGRAYAQPGNPGAIAQTLFRQGRDLADQNKWPEACAAFEASMHHAPAPGTRLNLARCYEHIGKLAGAWSLYQETIALAGSTGDKWGDYAKNQAAALQPRLARLVISAPATLPAGFAVTRSGMQIGAAALGSALYLDAGPHELTAWAPGFEAFKKTVMLVAGKIETLAIPELVPASLPLPDPPELPIGDHVRARELVVPAPPAHANAATTGSAGVRSSNRKYITIGIGATGVAAAGIGLLFGAKAISAYGDAKELCGASLVCAPADFDRGKQLSHDARFDAMTSAVLVVAGSAAIITSVIVRRTGLAARERTTARITPVHHERGAGLTIIGQF